MKEYTIYYIGTEDGETMNMVASAYGRTKEEAVEDFKEHMEFCGATFNEITSVEIYR